MLFNPANQSANKNYFLMTQTLVPRPIAWVLSENHIGTFNLAPFSYFNGISSDPTLIMLSVGKKDAETLKDTRCNIEEQLNFVVHIPSIAHLNDVSTSSATLPRDQSELDLMDHQLCDFDGFNLPRIATCKVAYACIKHEIIEMGNLPQSLIIGEVIKLYIADDIVSIDDKNRVTVDCKKLDPLSRLGANEYAGIGTILSAKRPQ